MGLENKNFSGNNSLSDVTEPSWDRLCAKHEEIWGQPLSESVAFKNSFNTKDIFVSQDVTIQQIDDEIQRIAESKIKVLINGKSGTGKELIGRAIHCQSKRSKKVFLPVDCSSIPESLCESTLFGHVKGAFTGAIADSLGFFRAADGGTIFLDEIAEIPLTMQAKLQRAIQQQTVTPVGSSKSFSIDVRIVSATNADLEKMVEEGRFRKDLFYRINGYTIILPELRKRPGDILALAQFFITRFIIEYEKPTIKGITDDCKTVLLQYRWPGNIRELENAMERAVVLCTKSFILPEHVFPEPDSYHPITETNGESLRLASYDAFLPSKTKEKHERYHKFCEEHLAAGEKEPPKAKQMAAELKVTVRQARRLRQKACLIWPVSGEDHSPVSYSS